MRSETFPPVAEHHCTLFYFAKKDDNPKLLTLAELVSSESQWLVKEDKDRILSKEKDGVQPLWQQKKNIKISTDFHPHIRSLFIDHSTVWQPTDKLFRLLTGKRLAYKKETPKEQRKPSLLKLALSNVACKRLKNAGISCEEEGEKICLDIKKVRLYELTPGFYTTALKVSFSREDEGPLHPAWIVEAVYHLARINECAWCSSEKKDRELVQSFSFGGLARSLIGDLAQKERRVYSSTFFRFDQALEAGLSRDLAVYSSRHYNSDYHITDKMSKDHVLSEFENVIQLATLEGTATVLDHDNRQVASYLKESYSPSAYNQAYLPLTLLAFHEHNVLKSLNLESQAQELPRPDNDGHEHIERLKSFLSETLQHRLRFQHPIVSGISMHNRFYTLLRRGFHLDEQLAKIEADTRDLSTIVQEYNQAISNYRMRLINGLATGGLTFIAAFEIVKEISKVFDLFGSWAGVVAASAGIFCGIIGGYIQYSRMNVKPSKV